MAPRLLVFFLRGVVWDGLCGKRLDDRDGKVGFEVGDRASASACDGAAAKVVQPVGVGSQAPGVLLEGGGLVQGGGARVRVVPGMAEGRPGRDLVLLPGELVEGYVLVADLDPLL